MHMKDPTKLKHKPATQLDLFLDQRLLKLMKLLAVLLQLHTTPLGYGQFHSITVPAT